MHERNLYLRWVFIPPLAVRHYRESEHMDEDVLYNVEIFQTPRNYTAKMRSNVKPQRPVKEYKAGAIEEILGQIVRDILDEFEE